MSNIEKYLLILILILFVGCQIQPATNGQLIDENVISEKQSNLIFNKSKTFPNGTQVSVAFIDGSTTKFYGIKRQNDTIFSFENRDKVFEIGSITKIFTSTLLANAVLDNKVGLNDNIDDYLGFKLKDGAKITFEGLANHTSGLPKMPSNLDAPNTFHETALRFYGESNLRKYLTEHLKLSKLHGKKSQYSNLGAALLAYTLTKIDCTSYENLLQSKIFKKYHMTRSTSNKDIVKDYLVKGLNSKGNEVPNLDLSALVGGGGILSTVEDLSKFANAQYDASNLELTLTRNSTFTVDKDSDIGLAWRILKTEDGQNIFYHGGKTKGYTSYLAFNEYNKNGVVILSNVSGQSKESNNIIFLGFSLLTD